MCCSPESHLKKSLSSSGTSNSPFSSLHTHYPSRPPSRDPPSTSASYKAHRAKIRRKRRLWARSSSYYPRIPQSTKRRQCSWLCRIASLRSRRSRRPWAEGRLEGSGCVRRRRKRRAEVARRAQRKLHERTCWRLCGLRCKLGGHKPRWLLLRSGRLQRTRSAFEMFFVGFVILIYNMI
jgi:hypothetical protein